MRRLLAALETGRYIRAPTRRDRIFFVLQDKLLLGVRFAAKEITVVCTTDRESHLGPASARTLTSGLYSGKTAKISENVGGNCMQWIGVFVPRNCLERNVPKGPQRNHRGKLWRRLERIMEVSENVKLPLMQPDAKLSSRLLMRRGLRGLSGIRCVEMIFQAVVNSIEVGCGI